MKKNLTILMIAIAVLLLITSCNGSPGSGEPEADKYKVGDTGPAGGIIFYVADKVETGTYVDKNNVSQTYSWKYLEAAPSDISGGPYKFGCNAVNGLDRVAAGANGSSIGSGRQNTRLLVNHIGSTGYTGTNLGDGDNVGTNYAAYLCDNYSLISTVDQNVYSDWFLPSVVELTNMYSNLKAENRGGTWQNGLYWSSTETGNETAYAVNFTNNQGDPNQSRTLTGGAYIRPVRAFE